MYCTLGYMLRPKNKKNKINGNLGALWDCGIRIKIHADWSDFVGS